MMWSRWQTIVWPIDGQSPDACMHISRYQLFTLYTFVYSGSSELCKQLASCHYNDIIMSTMASQITSLTIIYSTINSVADQRKHQSSVSLAFVRGFHWWPMNSPHKGPVMRKMFPSDDVIMYCFVTDSLYILPISCKVILPALGW